VRNALPKVSIVSYYVDFEGVWTTEPELASPPS
jgi:hypothetical protein